jgi:hypothetical protein
MNPLLENLIDIAKDLGIFAIAGGFITILFKRSSDKKVQDHIAKLDKENQQFQSELEHKNDQKRAELSKDIEVLKHELQETKFKTSKVYEKQFDVLIETSSLLHNLKDSLLNLTLELRLITGDEKKQEDEEKERIQKAQNDYQKVYECYKKNRIIYSVEFDEELKFIRLSNDSFWNYTYDRRFSGIDWKISSERKKEAADTVRNNLTPSLDQLANDYRTFLKVG